MQILPTCFSAVLVARMLAQALSNMVTTNEPLMSKLWETYMNLPEDQVILTYDYYSINLHRFLIYMGPAQSTIGISRPPYAVNGAHFYSKLCSRKSKAQVIYTFH